MIPMNVPFAKADLSSHVLRMFLYTWQQQLNLNKKGGTPMDMCLLVLSLEAIEHICSQERSKRSNASRDGKALRRKKKGTQQHGTEATAIVPKKAHAKKHCNLCKKHGAAYTTHNTRDCRRFEKDRSEKSDFHAAKKGRKNPNTVKQSFTQLSEKLDKLEKVIKKKDAKKQKRCSRDSNSDFD